MTTNELAEAAYALAMRVLQSDAYQDPDIRDAVDRVLSLSSVEGLDARS